MTKIVYDETMTLQPRPDATHSEVAMALLKERIHMYHEDWAGLTIFSEIKEDLDGTAQFHVKVYDPKGIPLLGTMAIWVGFVLTVGLVVWFL